jgi:hypothetical protein
MLYFRTQNPNFSQVLESLAIEDVGIFRVHLVNFTANSYILWPFGIFFPFGVLSQEKSGNPECFLLPKNSHSGLQKSPKL